MSKSEIVRIRICQNWQLSHFGPKMLWKARGSQRHFSRFSLPARGYFVPNQYYRLRNGLFCVFGQAFRCCKLCFTLEREKGCWVQFSRQQRARCDEDLSPTQYMPFVPVYMLRNLQISGSFQKKMVLAFLLCTRSKRHVMCACCVWVSIYNAFGGKITTA